MGAVPYGRTRNSTDRIFLLPGIGIPLKRGNPWIAVRRKIDSGSPVEGPDGDIEDAGDDAAVVPRMKTGDGVPPREERHSFDPRSLLEDFDDLLDLERREIEFLRLDPCP